MSVTQWWILLGAFLGGALPWLEAIVVIPVAIVAGGPAVPVLLAAMTGNLLTVWLAAVFGARVRTWWSARRAARREADGGEHPEVAERRHRRAVRVERVMNRWGMPGLALLGPLGLGTQLSALAAVAVGVSARVAFIWVGAGTVLWSLVATGLTVAGVSAFGIGA